MIVGAHVVCALFFAMASPATLLLDNGSLEPAATLALRELAGQLSSRLGLTVAPVSLLHSSVIDPAALGGQPAEILVPALERRLAAGQTEFVIVPLFFGPIISGGSIQRQVAIFLIPRLPRFRRSIRFGNSFVFTSFLPSHSKSFWPRFSKPWNGIQKD